MTSATTGRPWPGLAVRCRSAFGSGDRDRGSSYAVERRLIHVEANPTHHQIAALVRGSKRVPYEVSLSWASARRGFIEANCSCPRFQDTCCKHLWALILYVDESGLGHEVPGNGSLRIDHADFGLSDEMEESEGEGFNWEPSKSPEDLLLEINGQEKSEWRRQLDRIGQRDLDVDEPPWANPHAPDPLPQGSLIHYRIEISEALREGDLWIHLFAQRADPDTGAADRDDVKLECIQLNGLTMERVAFDAEEGQALNVLLSCPQPEDGYAYRQVSQDRRLVPPPLHELVLRSLASTGRLAWTADANSASDVGSGGGQVLAWDEQEPWQLRLEGAQQGRGMEITPWLTRLTCDGFEAIPLDQPLAIFAGGLLIEQQQISRHSSKQHLAWVSELRRSVKLTVLEDDIPELIETLFNSPQPPEIVLPDEHAYPQVKIQPQLGLRIHTVERTWGPPVLHADLWFGYGDRELTQEDPRTAVADPDQRRLLLRNIASEVEARERLFSLGFKRSPQYEHESHLRVSRPAFEKSVAELLDEGWSIEAEGSRLRRAAKPQFRVSSKASPTGIDWFELAGEVDFEGESLRLPELLETIREKRYLVQLGDGSKGVLPAEWLERYAPLAALAESVSHKHRDGSTEARVPSSQVGFLDALLAAESVDTDAKYEQIRSRMRNAHVAPELSEPRGFRGELRPYQRSGLAWLTFLESVGLGGCLADDMGLGKTVQVLAYLQRRRIRRRGDPKLPTLVVAPKSVVFNWRNETARFTPRIGVIEHIGPGRSREVERLNGADLVITTYGTLRRDALLLHQVEWDVVILDEAQAIKNPNTKTAKSARLLNTRIRLALSGTPIENRLGDLLSIFEFLNPGMLGRSKALRHLLNGEQSSEKNLQLFARGLKPLILRRTKEEVLTDLPPKTEQVLGCELDPTERRNYNQLAAHYRASLRQEVEEHGFGKSKIHVLEALLRLRQAACHRALIDPELSDLSSSKLDRLFEQLEESGASGHKSLVFSQFTSFLALVRRKLDEDEVPYAYLDGKTTDREACVDRFQNDPDCKLFLISLKAGGQGLNLTAADYVFLLDPWWNPAVEAQAIDRAHRIGQTNPVVAYRLIARDTVEEKILSLQGQKKQLADTLIRPDQGMLQGMNFEDLEQLLG